MTTKPGMLPGDDFSLAEWKAAQGQPSTAPEELPESVQLAYQQLLEVCQSTGVPHVAIFCLKGGIKTQYDLLDNPASVQNDVLTARGTVSGDLQHQIRLMGMALEGMDLSKLKGL